ncbi:hypothetical protein ACDZ28_28495 [Paenibacillus sp. RS8]|uniref:hypothetical protein n=1 Tax=Paenibacillus sp. RS8 TaxID=3242681 RepID=UPI0035C11CA1
MRKVYLLTLSLVLLFIFPDCDREQASDTVIKEVTVTSKGRVIQSIVMPLDKNTDLEEVSASFQSLTADPDVLIPYVKFGEIIQIEFSDTAPDSYNLTEYILRDDGTFKYKKETAAPVNVELEDKTATFKLDSNMASFLSSDSKDYEAGATIRGFRLTGEWVDQTKEITFVVRTDAK